MPKTTKQKEKHILAKALIFILCSVGIYIYSLNNFEQGNSTGISRFFEHILGVLITMFFCVISMLAPMLIYIILQETSLKEKFNSFIKNTFEREDELDIPFWTVYIILTGVLGFYIWGNMIYGVN